MALKLNKRSTLVKKEEKSESEPVVGTGPLEGSMSIATFTKKE